MTQTDLPGEVLAMTGRAADRLLKLDSGDAALAYLSLLRRGELPGWTRARLDAALEQLRKAGLAPAQAPEPAAAPAPEAPPRSTPPRTLPPPWPTGRPPSRPWPTRWSGGWARSCPPPI